MKYVARGTYYKHTEPFVEMRIRIPQSVHEMISARAKEQKITKAKVIHGVLNTAFKKETSA